MGWPLVVRIFARRFELTPRSSARSRALRSSTVRLSIRSAALHLRCFFCAASVSMSTREDKGVAFHWTDQAWVVYVRRVARKVRVAPREPATADAVPAAVHGSPSATLRGLWGR